MGTEPIVLNVQPHSYDRDCPGLKTEHGCIWCCDACNYDLHYCKGCGESLNHVQGICVACRQS